MTKSELIKQLAKKHNSVFAKDIELLVNTVLDEVSRALAESRRIELRGFGSFSIRRRSPRTARNPRTNEKVQLGQRNAIYFRAGKELRERINNE